MKNMINKYNNICECNNINNIDGYELVQYIDHWIGQIIILLKIIKKPILKQIGFFCSLTYW